MKFRERMQRFAIGRNGPDQLYQLMMWVSLILLVVNMFWNNWILSVVLLLILSTATFRMLSRDLVRRRKENQAYLRFLSKIKGAFVMSWNRFRDRKTHIYKKCPQCRNTLRLPKIKGDHTVCCPCCGNRFQINV